MSRSYEQHLADLQLGKFHFSQGGKGCLNRHEKDYKEGNPCSHRWQARELGQKLRKIESGCENKNLYDWPSDVDKQPPAGTTWSLDGTNFTTDSTVPYAHESHHVVPTNELAVAINSIGKESPLKDEIKLLVRKGLLQEGYNLNDQVNMLILPLNREEAYALALPKHKRTIDDPSHYLYSRYVKDLLKDVFADVKKDVNEHEEEAKENEKQAKKEQREGKQLDKKAQAQEQLYKKNEAKGWQGRAGQHKQRAESLRSAQAAQQAMAQEHAGKARELRAQALGKVKSNPTGKGKQGIVSISKQVRGEIIEAGLWMKQRGMDGSLQDLNEYLKERASQVSNQGGLPD